MDQVIVVTGPGSIGVAIARRVAAGKHVVLADLHQRNADRAADVMRNAGFDVSATTVDVSSRDSVLALVWLRPRIHSQRGCLSRPSVAQNAPGSTPPTWAARIAESA